MKRLLLLAALLCGASVVEAATKIAWFNRMSESGQDVSEFWPVAKNFMIAAAEDLGIELDIYYADANHVRLISLVDRVLADKQTLPDGVLFYNWKNTGKAILESAERQGVPAFLFNAGFTKDDAMGAPLEKYRFWVGQMLPDDEQAGYLLAESLVEMHKQNRRDDQPIQMIAIEGLHVARASSRRVIGLKKFLADNPSVIIHQVFPSDWGKESARFIVQHALKRYPKTDIIWAASDSLAYGAIEGAKTNGFRPGEDLLIGGIDLLPQSSRLLVTKELSVSNGGHYLDGAFSLIRLYDYLNGHKPSSNEAYSVKTTMIAKTSTMSDLGDLEEMLSVENIREKIDFKQYSKVYNPNLDNYRFSAQEILNQL